MKEATEGYQVARLKDPSPTQLVETIDSAERANIDMQVSTAHAYPRNIRRCIDNATDIATTDEETAKSCSYALPRGGKPITGPSVHLARIIAQQYGNLRAEAKVVGITDTQVISRGTAWDLENNYAVAFEVRRSIMGKTGRYSDDMITVTGNAANAIAYRNAVFALVPKSITDKVYLAARHLITGDLSDEDKLIKRRQAAIRHFNDQYGITEDEVIKLCGKHTVNQLRGEEIALLIGIVQSLKDGDITVDELMAPIRDSKEAKSGKLTDIARKAGKKNVNAGNIVDVQAQVVDTETGEIKSASTPGDEVSDTSGTKE